MKKEPNCQDGSCGHIDKMFEDNPDMAFVKVDDPVQLIRDRYAECFFEGGCLCVHPSVASKDIKNLLDLIEVAETCIKHQEMNNPDSDGSIFEHFVKTKQEIFGGK